mmetsp:Transcript_19418/g.25087  ORF Transcript_19418/g.25087 Transcript_19418/m.25087 type:complete len:204 (+) Transcript_19418:81-692(+)
MDFRYHDKYDRDFGDFNALLDELDDFDQKPRAARSARDQDRDFFAIINQLDDFDPPPSKSKSQQWKTGLKVQERPDGGNMYAWDRPITGNEVEGMMKHRQRYEANYGHHLHIADGVHGTKNMMSYKEDFVPKGRGSFVEPKFHQEDVEIVNRLGMQSKAKVHNVGNSRGKKNFDQALKGRSHAKDAMIATCYGTDNRNFVDQR